MAISCTDSGSAETGNEPLIVSVTYDGETREIPGEAGNVRQFLEENDIKYGPSDLVDPPLFTPLQEVAEITIVRVTESIEVIERMVPFERRTVRNESMNADDPPVIIQSGKPGLQEVTVRIVYHDSLEFSRQETQVSVIEPAQDEIVMIGVGAIPGNLEFDGYLAFNSGGNSVIMRGSSSFPDLLNTGNNLDHRVFSLSPTGDQLLYTKAVTETGRFNSLWVIGTGRGDVPRSLGVDNVLWADWNPSRIGDLQLAYTTGEFTELLPGWEANNDLWIGELPADRFDDFDPEQIVDVYPASYGWWGGNYEWSPQGRYIAYSYADEVGVIDTFTEDPDEQRLRLHSFTDYTTRADWVWLPALSWSPDGRYLVFTKHAGQDTDLPEFEIWVIDATTGLANRFVEQAGMWSYPFWSPEFIDPLSVEGTVSQIAFLRTTNPVDSQRSAYSLWLMDRDASNERQIYPPAGENSRFPRGGKFMAWSPQGNSIAFVYDNSLYLYLLDSGETGRITQDDNVVRNPTWAPYGPYASDLLQFGEGAADAIFQLTDQEEVLPE